MYGTPFGSVNLMANNQVLVTMIYKYIICQQCIPAGKLDKKLACKYNESRRKIFCAEASESIFRINLKKSPQSHLLRKFHPPLQGKSNVSSLLVI